MLNAEQDKRWLDKSGERFCYEMTHYKSND